MSDYKTGESNGGEDIDELFAEIDGVVLHIEKMADNEYFIGLSKGDKTLTTFIGHWPRKGVSKGKLKLNITENGCEARWSR